MKVAKLASALAHRRFSKRILSESGDRWHVALKCYRLSEQYASPNTRLSKLVCKWKHDRQCTYSVILKRVRVTSVAVEKQ
jgi:hypothetical protein